MTRSAEKPQDDVCEHCGAWVMDPEVHTAWHRNLRSVLNAINLNGYNPNQKARAADIATLGGAAE